MLKLPLECSMCSGSISEALFTEKCCKLLQTMFRFSLSEHLGHHCCCIVSLRDVRKESAGYVLSQAGAKPSHPAQPCASFGGRVQVLLICVTWDRSSYTQLWVHMCVLKYILWAWLESHISWVSKVLLWCPHWLFLCSQDIWDVLARSLFSSCSKIFKLTKLYWLCPWKVEIFDAFRNRPKFGMLIF